jgi:hypothetical protein
MRKPQDVQHYFKYIGFTGSQKGTQLVQLQRLEELLRFLMPRAGHHGCCVGADCDFHELCGMLGIGRVLHPPVNTSKIGPTPMVRGDFIRLPFEYLVRNKNIVDSTDALIACPSTMRMQMRSGTWATVRYAHKLHRPVYIITPDGRLGYHRVKLEHQLNRGLLFALRSS